MDTWHYDQSDPDLKSECGIDIEHIYCLDHINFSTDDEAMLDMIFRTLPGSYADSGDWFEGRLQCSFEPIGLQVFGLLDAANWQEWHEKFVAAVEATSLPKRIVSRLDS